MMIWSVGWSTCGASAGIRKPQFAFPPIISHEKSSCKTLKAAWLLRAEADVPTVSA